MLKPARELLNHIMGRLSTNILPTGAACLAITANQAFQFLQLRVVDVLVLQQIDQKLRAGAAKIPV